MGDAKKLNKVIRKWLDPPFYDLFIVSCSNRYLKVWNYFDKACCLFSPHIYLYMASFLSKDSKFIENFNKLDKRLSCEN